MASRSIINSSRKINDISMQTTKSGIVDAMSQFRENDNFTIYIERFEQYCTANNTAEKKIMLQC